MAPRRRRQTALPVVAVATLLLALPFVVDEADAAPATLPVAEDGKFVTALEAPVVAPGGSGAVTWMLANPLAGPISGVTLDLSVYAFNAYPGNATGPVPAASGAPTFGAAGVPSYRAQVGTLPPGGSTSGSAPFSVGGGAPQGTYAIRVAVNFTGPNGSYVLESRGFFGAALWASATSGPNGTSTLNVTRLGVSGVVPETAVLVRSNPYTIPLYVLLGVGFVLAAAGAYYAFRRGPGSSSGVRGADPPQSAPSALGNRATSDGDRSRS